jgi:WD40 repeat protein
MLYRFDARTGQIVASFDLGHEKGIGVNSIAFAYGYAWTASGPAGRVRRWTLPTLPSS